MSKFAFEYIFRGTQERLMMMLTNQLLHHYSVLRDRWLMVKVPLLRVYLCNSITFTLYTRINHSIIINLERDHTEKGQREEFYLFVHLVFYRLE